MYTVWHVGKYKITFNPLNLELNPICHMLALLGARHILHVSRIRVKCKVELCYNDVGLCGISFIASDILWHQLIPYQ